MTYLTDMYIWVGQNKVLCALAFWAAISALLIGRHHLAWIVLSIGLDRDKFPHPREVSPEFYREYTEELQNLLRAHAARVKGSYNSEMDAIILETPWYTRNRRERKKAVRRFRLLRWAMRMYRVPTELNMDNLEKFPRSA